MLKTKLIETGYKKIAKPMFFKQDAETVHNNLTEFGEALVQKKYLRNFTQRLLSYNDGFLSQEIHGINFKNPIGLSAGFDYDGHLADTMQYVGFGFNTVGTVTAKSYEGNKKPRLERLPKSKSLLVNKGFKSQGVDKVLERLDSKNLTTTTLGISVGSTNIPEVNTIKKAIDDYLDTFRKFKNKEYVKYFELNISCPNAAMNENFANTKNFKQLLTEVKKLRIKQPIWIKMANELSLNETDILVRNAISYGMSGFIFSNLVKDRDNKYFNKAEIQNFSEYKGNFSGKPTEKNANRLIKHFYKEYGKDTKIIGCGGIFNANDAYEKIKLGASLVQLITGMIYEGPQLIGKINQDLAKLLKADGYKNISEAVGKGV